MVRAHFFDPLRKEQLYRTPPKMAWIGTLQFAGGAFLLAAILTNMWTLGKIQLLNDPSDGSQRTIPGSMLFEYGLRQVTFTFTMDQDDPLFKRATRLAFDPQIVSRLPAAAPATAAGGNATANGTAAAAAPAFVPDYSGPSALLRSYRPLLVEEAAVQRAWVVVLAWSDYWRGTKTTADVSYRDCEAVDPDCRRFATGGTVCFTLLQAPPRPIAIGLCFGFGLIDWALFFAAYYSVRLVKTVGTPVFQWAHFVLSACLANALALAGVFYWKTGNHDGTDQLYSLKFLHFYAHYELGASFWIACLGCVCLVLSLVLYTNVLATYGYDIPRGDVVPELQEQALRAELERLNAMEEAERRPRAGPGDPSARSRSVRALYAFSRALRKAGQTAIGARSAHGGTTRR
eukprot:tig00000789_g4123.t1